MDGWPDRPNHQHDFHQLGETMRRFAKYYVEEGDAQDVVQSVMTIMIAKGVHERCDRAALKRWAYQAARYVLGNHFQAAAQARRRYAPFEAVLRDQASPAPDAYAHGVARDLAAALRRALRRMPAGQRRIIRLLVAGATRSEMQAALGVTTLKDLRKRIWRARERLKTELAAEGYPLRSAPFSANGRPGTSAAKAARQPKPI